MRDTTRLALAIVSLVLSLAVLGVAAAELADCARTVELVGLLGGAFGAGASATSLIARRLGTGRASH